MAWQLRVLAGLTGFLWSLAMFQAVPARKHPDGWAWTNLARRMGRLLEALGGTGLVERLLQADSWMRASREALGLLRNTMPGLGLEEACAALILAGGLAELLLGLLSGSFLGLAVGIAGWLIAIPIWASGREHAERASLAAEMPSVFRSLALALGSGQTLSQAIEYVGSSERGVAGREFARAGLQLRCGAPAEESLLSLADRLDAPGVDLLVTALLISRRTGSPLKELFQSSASLVERQGEFERALNVKTAQVRFSVRIVCLLPAAIVATLSLVSPDFRAGLSTPAGIVSITVAIAMDAAALLIIRHILRGVL